MPEFQWLDTAASYVSTTLEAIAILVVAGAALQAVFGLVRLTFARDPRTSNNDVRLTFGRWLVVALEFLLAADIVATAVAPSWEELGKLGIIAAIRTALNYFLEREIEHEIRRSGAGPDPSA